MEVEAGPKVLEVSEDIRELAAKLGIDPNRLIKAAERAVNSGASAGERYQRSYQRMKERAAADPAYAAKLKTQRNAYAKKRSALIKEALEFMKAKGSEVQA